MRCDCCDKELSDAEVTAKFVESGNYVGMCKGCMKHLPRNLLVKIRSDLDERRERREKEAEDADLNYLEDYDEEE